jgi:hypothetical protein
MTRAAKSYAKKKSNGEAYLRLLQTLFLRCLSLHASYCRQALAVYNILDCLKKKKDAETMLDDELNRCFNNHLGKVGNRSTASVDSERSRRSITGIEQQETCSGNDKILFTTVYLKKARRSVLVYLGQAVKTPLGTGKVTLINPEAYSVTILLSFGVMYAHLARMVCWIDPAFVLDSDASSIALVSQLEETQPKNNTGTFTMSSHTYERMKKVAECDSDNSDYDEESTPDQARDDDGGSATSKESSGNDEDEEEEEADAAAGEEEKLSDHWSEGERERCDGAAAASAGKGVDGLESAARAQAAGRRPTTTEGILLGSALSLHPTSSNLPTSASLTTILTEAHTSVFPLKPSCANGDVGSDVVKLRSDMRRHLAVATAADKQDIVTGEVVWPLALLPPGNDTRRTIMSMSLLLHVKSEALLYHNVICENKCVHATFSLFWVVMCFLLYRTLAELFASCGL